ncbi:unnamed protein product [Rotaria sp. Silwood2]|nr:unnamed protein product [Rotaria sp. Silwood2]CAF4017380.1 unnamed protein product [Rotaria sp. Silwood2]CAF4104464.1 unnamed protein product [Rotaria sp. Silwood2]CAF4306700.1 unnamed protein product [Rotaria sp. Silwood2]
MWYLYYGPNYTRPNQSYLPFYKYQQKQVQQEHKNIMNIHLFERYMTSICYLEIYRVRKELKRMKSIQHRLKKEKYILRVTDKSGIFHIGHTIYYDKKKGTSLRPIVTSTNMPTTGISKSLDELFDHYLINMFANDYLKPTNNLCTFDIIDLYTMLPQEESVDILTEFLLQYGYRKVKHIPIDAIQKLAHIVITENVFIYEKKFCRQIIGGAMGSAFILTLANIFMWKWEQKLDRRQAASNEIYVRSVPYIK